MEEILKLLEQPEDLGFSILHKRGRSDTDQAKDLRRKLQVSCQSLFQRVEQLGTLYNKRLNETKRNGGQGLTGLNSLYFCSDEGLIGDAEMVYGQVELQNEAVRKLLKSANKKLSKAALESKDVRLLEEQYSDEENLDGENEEGTVEGDDDSSEEEENHETSETEEQRIQARMNRVMDDMSDDDEGDDEEEIRMDGHASGTNEDLGVVDSVADSLKDGFFDLQEMEAFADEEEEYLPDEAFGTERDDEQKDAFESNKSLHQKLREGTIDDGSDGESDDDDDYDALHVRTESTIKRKRYRDDDEIEALYKLYDKPQSTQDSDEDDDPASMTASDIFGKPVQKYYDKWYVRKDRSLPFEDEAYGGFDSKQNYEMDEHDVLQPETKGQDSSDQSEVEDEELPMNDERDEAKSDVEPKVGRKQEKLKKQIDQLEQEMISEKPWQMKGEVQATSRPQDSLLELTPEFEVAAKQAPIITVQHTADLEDIIKNRILEEDWDDVVPRELPDVAWNKKKGELPEVSQEKSKLGLGELYEREYLKKAVGFDVDAAEKEGEEEKAKNEMKSLFANLCSKLDALSNYHFAPRPVADEMELRPITKPTIAMEEVLPLHESSTRGVAPEEVFGSKRGRDGVLRGDSELEQQDRKRLRSAKKASRRKARKAELADEKLLARLQPGLGLNNPYEKRKMREELSAARARGKVTTGEVDSNSYGKSTTFFKRMQNEAQAAIRSKKTPDPSANSDNDHKRSSTFKL
mmetsp:Transcript_977/g.2742  ORF Transcript_977/g.2742 Transcript_977/m.2742 type:complete len:747 (+) Transcript_977:46-2286(+)